MGDIVPLPSVAAYKRRVELADEQWKLDEICRDLDADESLADAHAFLVDVEIARKRRELNGLAK